MRPIKKRIRNLSSEKYYMLHLSIVHQLLPTQLTNKEIEVLANFMSLQGDIVSQDRFGTQARKIVMERMGLRPGGLGNYLRTLEEKAYIRRSGKSFVIPEFLVPDQKEQGYQFLIEKE